MCVSLLLSSSAFAQQTCNLSACQDWTHGKSTLTTKLLGATTTDVAGHRVLRIERTTVATESSADTKHSDTETDVSYCALGAKCVSEMTESRLTEVTTYSTNKTSRDEVTVDVALANDGKVTSKLRKGKAFTGLKQGGFPLW
jgi:hypothetical protein